MVTLTCPTYPDEFIRDSVVAPFVQTLFVIVTRTTLSEFAATLHAIRSCFTVFFSVV